MPDRFRTLCLARTRLQSPPFDSQIERNIPARPGPRNRSSSPFFRTTPHRDGCCGIAPPSTATWRWRIV